MCPVAAATTLYRMAIATLQAMPPSLEPRRFAAFGNRNFRLYFIGQTISSVGSWLQSLAAIWLVLQMTNRSDRLGVAVALQFLPMLLLGAPAGCSPTRSTIADCSLRLRLRRESLPPH
jgi:Transmembrane secretion effector